MRFFSLQLITIKQTNYVLKPPVRNGFFFFFAILSRWVYSDSGNHSYGITDLMAQVHKHRQSEIPGHAAFSMVPQVR